MNEFAIVSEGVTDYAVLKSILFGWFKEQDAEPFLKPYQPDPTAEGESSWQEFGNWENVLKYLEEKKHRTHSNLQIFSSCRSTPINRST